MCLPIPKGQIQLYRWIPCSRKFKTASYTQGWQAFTINQLGLRLNPLENKQNMMTMTMQWKTALMCLTLTQNLSPLLYVRTRHARSVTETRISLDNMYCGAPNTRPFSTSCCRLSKHELWFAIRVLLEGALRLKISVDNLAWFHKTWIVINTCTLVWWLSLPKF